MSYGTSSGDPGPSRQVDIQHVQKKLQSLLERLKWSYVTLWSFNPQSRSLEWTGGDFKRISPAQSSAEVFNFQKNCTFTPGQGSVGEAYAEKRYIWKNGPSVHLSAGSQLQARILEHARIETAVYIPWAETVLELGTTGSVAEDMHLMNGICDFMWGPILPVLGHAQAPPHVSQSPLAPPLLSRESHEFVNQDFELNEQTRRTSGLNISDRFWQHPNEDEELGITSSVPTEPTWIPSPITSRPTDLLQSPNPSLPVSAANQQVLRRLQAHRSPSGTTSSSLSSLEDTSVRLSDDSPERSISLMALSSQRHNSQNIASSSARRETPSHSSELQPVGTTGFPGPAPHLPDVQYLIRQMLGSQESWAQITYIDPSLEPRILPPSGFKIWPPHTHVPRRREGSMNQGLLRRSFEILRQNHNLQQSNQPLPEAPMANRGPHRGPSSSSAEDMPAHDLLPQAGPSTGTRRRRVSTPGSGNDEAAKNHMLSERQRRKKQKDNFAALRKLVPIISKNDKASILSDAIIYIEDLQLRIRHAEADTAEMQSRYETLKSSHQELQERNKQLEAALVAATSSGGASSILPPP